MRVLIKSICISLLTLLCTSVSAQKVVRGCVQTDDGKSIPFANISLLNAADSSMVKSCMADSIGRFSLQLPAEEASAYFGAV